MQVVTSSNARQQQVIKAVSDIEPGRQRAAVVIRKATGASAIDDLLAAAGKALGRGESGSSLQKTATALRLFLDEPRLLFVGANDIAHQQVIGAIVAEFGSAPRRRPHAVENALVGSDQPYKLQRRFLAVPPWSRQQGRFRAIG